VQNRTSEINAALANLAASADDIAADLGEKIQGTAQLHYGLARARDLDTRDKAACSAFLSDVREEYPQFTGILTIDPDGRSRKIWLQPDGTWTGLSRRGLDLAGTWKTDGDKVCLSQSKPSLPGKMCEKFPTDPEAGVETKDPTGKTIRLKLVKGHVKKY